MKLYLDLSRSYCAPARAFFVLFLIVFLPVCVHAGEVDVLEGYTPPPLFSEDSADRYVAPPLTTVFPVKIKTTKENGIPVPPRRPEKLMASKVFVDEVRKAYRLQESSVEAVSEDKAQPEIVDSKWAVPVKPVARRPIPPGGLTLEEQLAEPSAVDVLRQIE